MESRPLLSLIQQTGGHSNQLGTPHYKASGLSTPWQLLSMAKERNMLLTSNKTLIICNFQDFEADFRWKANLKFLNSGIILKMFVNDLWMNRTLLCKTHNDAAYLPTIAAIVLVAMTVIGAIPP